MDWDVGKPWYYGSPFSFSSLRAGSIITKDPDLARAFSHKPSVVVQDIDDNEVREIKHSGGEPGFRYRVAEKVEPEDGSPPLQTTMLPGQERGCYR